MAAEQPVELYKRHRPDAWGKLIGQEKVADSLRRAVVAGKIPTAYLFAGPRGCGKTSAAFLLAKAINCLNRHENGDPCNACEVCLSIEAGNQLGVSYVSVANQQGVDRVREIADSARISQPVRRQVFILDEVHNWSKAAWDALLIPLEEKTMPALFILCTTEVNKVPETVLSRVQKRRFSLVEAGRMAELLRSIASQEDMDLSDEEIVAAVKLGRGSVRDTLSALDSVVDAGEVASSFGGRLLEGLSKKSVAAVFSVLAEAAKDGVDFRAFGEQTFEDLRDLLLVAAKVDREYIGIPPVKNEADIIRGLGGPRGIMMLMNEVGEAITKMTLGTDSRILLEIALLSGVAKLNKAAQAAAAKK